MFDSLGLKITDDKAAIDAEIKKRRPRYLRDLKSPDPLVQTKAKQWFKDVDDITRNRGQLLDIVYQAAARNFGVALAGFIAGGKTRTLSPAMVQSLRDILVTTFHVDEELAEVFIDKYLQEKNLSIGDPIVHVNLVKDFRGQSGQGKITLSWKNPGRDFDLVEIIRLDTESGKTTQVYQGIGTSCIDTSAPVGQWCSYQAYSVYKGCKSLGHVQATPDRLINLGEVSEQQAEWKSGMIHLTWKLPSPSASVLIFRRQNSDPAVIRSTTIPEPGSLDTRLVYKGSGTSWDDRQVEEGAVYHYLVVADYGAGFCSRGVTLQCRVPKAPPAPGALQASYRDNNGKNVVELSWSSIAGNLAVEYVLLRRQGTTPPAGPGDGKVIAETDQLGCVDKNVKPGHCYTYTLFTHAGEMYSRTDNPTARVVITPEVTDLKCKTGSGTVSLEWKRPQAATDIVVRRRLDPPKNAHDGKRIPLTGDTSAMDGGVSIGKKYFYRVCCEYRPDGTTPVYSPGRVIEATPVQLPEPVEELDTKMVKLEIICSWPDRDYGAGAKVVIYRSRKPHDLMKGTRMDLQTLASILDEIEGEPLATSAGGRSLDCSPDLEKPYYSAFTITGNHCVAGATSHCLACPDVDNLTLTPTRDGVILRWDWPADCKAVTVTRKNGSWPCGVDDPRATSVVVSRDEYHNSGGQYSQNLRKNQGHYHYVVYAQAISHIGTVHGAGASGGCRADTVWRPWMTLRYSLRKKMSGRGTKNMRICWEIEQPHEDFAGFMLLADRETVPQSADHGVELFRWSPPADGDCSGKHQDLVPLDPVIKEGWRDFYCRLVLLDPVQERSTLIIHPDVCQSIPANGPLPPTGRRAGHADDFHKTPKTALCPFCFNEFPIERIMFKPDSGGDPVPGAYTFLDRLFNRPVRPPKTKTGAMTRKVCPECKENLHSSAGAQKDLVIGMIGAKYSGKSHYVASLVDRLQGRASRDMYSSLLPLNDETITRYKDDFYKPLFENHLELDATAGVPPPLMYDLSFDSRLWNNDSGNSLSVTLALYDTAGENFDDKQSVRHLVQYLRVASGVILLVDPLQSRTMQDFLPPDLRSETRIANADPLDIISRVIGVLKEKQVVGDDGVFAKPVAMVMTKCDVLRQCGLLPENRLWAMDERHIGRFRRDIHDDMSGMMGEQLQRWNLPAYQAVRHHFPCHAFFGVSATGCAPDSRGRFPYVSPWRVVDPLFWILSELGVIPVSES